MASASFTIDGTSISAGLKTVSPSASVALALESTSGVAGVLWTCEGTHSSSVAPATITAAITPAGSPPGVTATLAFPAGANGQCYLIECQVTDTLGNIVTARGLVGSTNGIGNVPGAAGETTERDLVWGWTDLFNSVLSTALSPPSNPGDDDKVAYASSGDLAYAGGVKIVGSGAGLTTTYLEAGTGVYPAAGTLRWASGSSLYGRDTTTNDAQLMVWSSDDLTIGEDVHVDNVYLKGAVSVGAYVASTLELSITAGLIDAQDNEIRTSGHVSADYIDLTSGVGSSPAQAGAIRLVKGAGIYARNAADNDDIPLFFFGTADQLTVGNSTSLASIAFNCVGSTTVRKHLEVDIIAGNIAQSGSLRFTHDATVIGRNSGNSADVSLLNWGNVATDDFYVGDATVDLKLRGLTTALLDSASNPMLTVNTAKLDVGGVVDFNAHGAHFTRGTQTGTGTKDIDWTAGNKYTYTFGAGNVTFTFTAPAGSGTGAGLTLKLIQDGVGSRTAAWPATVKWVNGSAPTLTTGTPSAVDYVFFDWDGTNYYGMYGNAFS